MIAAAAILLAPAAAATPDTIRPQALWNSGADAVWAVPCAGQGDVDADCTALETRRGTRTSPLGTGYLPPRVGGVKVLWRRRTGERGPDLVVLGAPGGSSGCVDVFAVVFGTGTSPRVQKLQPCRDDEITVFTRDGAASTDMAFAVGGLRGAPNAATATVFLPLRWDGRRFALDRAALTARARDADDDALRFTAVADSLTLAAAHDDDVVAHWSQPAVTALLGLMVTGRADRARVILDRTWPAPFDDRTKATVPAPGKEAFWRELCRAAVRHAMWRDLDLDRLPHAALVEGGAREAAQP